MRFGQTTVTQDFGIEPRCLAAEGALYPIPDFRDQAIALQLPPCQRVVLRGFILNAVFNAA